MPLSPEEQQGLEAAAFGLRLQRMLLETAMEDPRTNWRFAEMISEFEAAQASFHDRLKAAVESDESDHRIDFDFSRPDETDDLFEQYKDSLVPIQTQSA